MDIKEIVIDYLKTHGYGGLCNPDAECGCDIDDLAPCGDCCNIVECMPAYKVEGRCKMRDHPCDGYDPEGPGICYTTQKPKGVTAEEIESDDDEWIGEHLQEDYAVCEAMSLQNGLNLTKWPEDKMERHLAQLEMITQYTQRVMDEIEDHVFARPAPSSEKALREAATSALRKLRAYVGVCSGDKELVQSIIPSLESALSREAPTAEKTLRKAVKP